MVLMRLHMPITDFVMMKRESEEKAQTNRASSKKGLLSANRVNSVVEVDIWDYHTMRCIYT